MKAAVQQKEAADEDHRCREQQPQQAGGASGKASGEGGQWVVGAARHCWWLLSLSDM